MDEQARPALSGLDRETFAAVWSRVAPGEGALEAAAPPAQEPDSRALQGLVLTCLSDAAAYRHLAGQTRKSAAALGALARKKTAQAKRLSAAYFLLTGLRYWPGAAAPADGPGGFFPALRRRFQAEGELAAALDSLSASATDPWYQELYQTLAAETEAGAEALRRMVEREF